jgi:DNA mismatch repair ATPase MutS
LLNHLVAGHWIHLAHHACQIINTIRPAPTVAYAVPHLAAVVANSLQLGGGAEALLVLTGSNMGGKSTLLRAVCIAGLMGQMGCFCPATSVLLEPVDHIFTRIGRC